MEKEMTRMIKDLNASKALRDKLSDTEKRIVEESGEQSSMKTLEKAAQELGYDVTAAELERYKASTEEINPESLQYVTGGADSDGPNWCWYDHACLATWKHDDKVDDPVCAADYYCYLVFHPILLDFPCPNENGLM